MSTTLFDAAQANDNFTILVAAIQAVDDAVGAGLESALSATDADLTVFAPTDAAFTSLAANLGFDGDTADETAVATFIVGALPAELIRDVILYHVSPGTQLLADIADGAPIATLNPDGATFTPDGPTLVDAEPDLIDPSLIDTDLVVDNGVIHVIDQVLIPADLDAFTTDSITGIVATSGAFDANSSDFDFLLNAVVLADLDGTLADPTQDLTVFAPNDAAFQATIAALGFEGGTEQEGFDFLVEALTLLGAGDPVPLLTAVLTFHVSPESLQASQVLTADSIPTLLGVDLEVGPGATLVDLEPDLADPVIIQTDIQATNGVVHVIDGVLIPADLLASDGSGDVDFLIEGDDTDIVFTGLDSDFVDGNGGSDLILAGRGDDTVLGGTGSDIIGGGRGDDTLRGDEGRDVVFGGRGDDALSGGGGRDLLIGGNGDDTVLGDGGFDRLFGGSGDDTLNGGAGIDRLTGGSGDDVFVFEVGSDRGFVRDFEQGEDLIDVSDYGFDSFAAFEARIEQGIFGARLKLAETDVAVLVGVEASDLTAGDFVFATQADTIA